MTRHSIIRGATIALAGLAIGACASAKKPGYLTQAEGIYSALNTRGGTETVEAEMIKTRQAIDSANMALAQNRSQKYVDGVAYVALRAAQTAEAEEARRMAMRAADSLKTARLNKLLSLTEAQRNALAQQQQLSQSEIAALHLQNAAAEQRADSLRRVAEEANAKLNDALTQLRSLVAEITNIKETSRGLVISLSDILFDVNQATLKAGAANNVQKIAAILNQYPNYRISVEGHTDSQGSDTYNQSLSERRAAAVLQQLVAGGVSADRITSKGFGESQPVASNDTPAGRQQNRRVEVVVLGAGKVADALQNGGTAPTSGDTTKAPPPR
jgi:outer membrane protein OmpA-like peptidoglycan-associated protein